MARAYQTIIIKPKQEKVDDLTDDQIKYIQKVLEQSCVGKFCISRSRLFDELKEPLKLKIEKYQFERIITKAIKEERIVGFRTKPGRNGGICKK